MANERITENLVRDSLRRLGYYHDDNVIIEEQKSSNPRIDKLMQNASKSGSGKGFPEFIITCKNTPDFVIVFECKADTNKHESPNRNKYKQYAVDGVLLYSSYLSKQFTVLSVAVSGTAKNQTKISYFIQNKQNNTVERIFGNQLLPISDILGGVYQEEKIRTEKYDQLLEYSKQLNDQLYTLKIKEDKRSMLISGILIALENDNFYTSYSSYTDSHMLAKFLISTIEQQLKNENLQENKRNLLLDNYRFIQTQPNLLSVCPKTHTSILKNLIDDIDDKVNGYVRTYKYYDVLGQFYIEFLRYSNADKGLGIVLTPPHMTDFFTDIADVKPNDVVYDNCTGTAGFLVSAMKKMIEKTQGNQQQIRKIKKNRLYGTEFQPEIYPLAVSNMFLHGDGKSNILHGSCFDKDIISTITAKKPTVAFLNPPYSTNIQEYEFIYNALEVLKKHGKCVAIVPMSCALATKGERLKWKQKILQRHTLKAVFSMPDELFHNSKVTTRTCIMVFEAKNKQPAYKETFFGYFKDDGFYKKKTKGRYDYNGKWFKIKQKWLYLYQNNKTESGLSVSKIVKAHDEWCAEAYMDTDYSTLNKENFIFKMKEYASYLILHRNAKKVSDASVTSNIFDLEHQKFKYFCIGDVFDHKKGKDSVGIKNLDYVAYADKNNPIPLVSATFANNGIVGYKNTADDNICYDGNSVTVAGNGSYIGESFYQEKKFVATSDVNILIPKYNVNKYMLFFIIVLIEMDQYRYNYGRKLGSSIVHHRIKLPSDNNGNPDWLFMEQYIKSLPYSSNI